MYNRKAEQNKDWDCLCIIPDVILDINEYKSDLRQWRWMWIITQQKK